MTADQTESESVSTFPDGVTLRGDVLAVERVPASEVPDEFPVAIWTETALALRLELPYTGEQTTTYFSLPKTDPDDRLDALLQLHGVTRPEELDGAGLLLETTDGHCLPLLLDEERKGDSRGIYGIVAGLAPSITIALFSFFGVGDIVFEPVFVAIWLVCTFVVLPISVYFDAWHLRTTTDWNGTPIRWAVLSAVPALLIVVVPYYLVVRENAQPLVFETPSRS